MIMHILENYGTGIGWSVALFGCYCMYLVIKLEEI